MALTEIVTDAEVFSEIGATLTGDDLTLMQVTKNRVEAMVRVYCRWSITSATYTHFLPEIAPVGNRLILPEPYVTSITSVHEDWVSSGGQGATDFPDESELTQGEDFFLDYTDSSMSTTGILVRRYKDWPPYERSVKVVYVAGLSASDLINKYYYVKEAILKEVVDRYRYTLERQGNSGSQGPVEMERLKDYTVRYGATSTVSRFSTGASGLFRETEMVLDPLVHMGVMF